MSDTAGDSTGRGVSVNVLATLDELGHTIATHCNTDPFAHNRSYTYPRKIMLTHGATASETLMIEFGPYGTMEWRFGVRLGDVDRLWFCRNEYDEDVIYRFEDSIYPQAYSEQECVELIDHLEGVVMGLYTP